jgi:hypothetical protein
MIELCAHAMTNHSTPVACRVLLPVAVGDDVAADPPSITCRNDMAQGNNVPLDVAQHM